MKRLTGVGLVVCAIIVAACSRGPSPEEARAELAKLQINYDVDTFVERAGASDPVVVKLFLAAGMNTNAHDSHDLSALYAASRCGDLITVRALLDNGAEIKSGESGTGNAVGIAASKGHTQIVQLLLDRLIAKTPSKVGRLIGDALQDAIWGGQGETTKTLIIRLKEVANKQDLAKELSSGLQTASYMGHIGIAEHLLDQGAIINSKDKDGYTPLMYAARNGNLEMVQTLIKRGADVDILNNNRETAIVLADSNSNWSISRVLNVEMAAKGNSFAQIELEELKKDAAKGNPSSQEKLKELKTNMAKVEGSPGSQYLAKILERNVPPPQK